MALGSSSNTHLKVAALALNTAKRMKRVAETATTCRLAVPAYAGWLANLDVALDNLVSAGRPPGGARKLLQQHRSHNLNKLADHVVNVCRREYGGR